VGEEAAVEAMKGCPFCSEAPRLRPERPEVEGTCWAIVLCTNERCPAQPAIGDGIGVSDDRGSDAYKAAAVERWNRRPGSNLLHVGADVGSSDWTSIVLELQVGPLVARVMERDIPEATMANGQKAGLLACAHAAGTLPELSGALTQALEVALKVYGDFLDREASRRRVAT
jgi:hypothetical protein